MKDIRRSNLAELRQLRVKKMILARDEFKITGKVNTDLYNQIVYLKSEECKMEAWLG